MTYEVIQPPATDEEMAKVGKEVLEAMHKLGRPVDTQGFLEAWISGVRVIAERDQAGEISGVALLTIGHRWLFMDYTASVLFKRCKDDGQMIQFIINLCKAMGAGILFVEKDDPIYKDDKESVHAVQRIKL